MASRIEVKAPEHSGECTAVVSYWYKQQGEPVIEDEDLVDYETDKATVTLPAPASGVLVEISVPEDGVVEPGMVLGYLETQ